MGGRSEAGNVPDMLWKSMEASKGFGMHQNFLKHSGGESGRPPQVVPTHMGPTPSGAPFLLRRQSTERGKDPGGSSFLICPLLCLERNRWWEERGSLPWRAAIGRQPSPKLPAPLASYIKRRGVPPFPAQSLSLLRSIFLW